MNLFANDPFFSGFESPFTSGNSLMSHRNGSSRNNGGNQSNRDLMAYPFDNDDLFSFGSSMRNPLSLMQSMMGNMHSMMENIEKQMNDPKLMENGKGLSFQSSTVMSMDNRDNNGQPKIFQATSERLKGPDGLERTRKAVRDSTRNVEKMEIAHRLGERGHRIVKERDPSTGRILENRELDHIDNEEEFQHEWQSKARNYGLGNSIFNDQLAIGRGARPFDNNRMAIDAPSSSKTTKKQSKERRSKNK